MKMEPNDPKVKKAFDDYSVRAQATIQNPDKLSKLLTDCEAKLSTLPGIGDALAGLLVFVDMLRSYLKKEYTAIPLTALVAIVAALIYFVAPVDLIPDFLPGIGHIDDAAVIAFALKQVKSTVDTYKQWRDANSTL